MEIKTKSKLLLAVGLLLPLLLSISVAQWPGFSHEDKTVGPYQLIFEGMDEPLITGERMWLEVQVTNLDTGMPVKGLEGQLIFEVERNGKKKELELSSVSKKPGHYKAAVIFTQSGLYKFHVQGIIGDSKVHVHFEKEVLDRANLYFP